MSKRNVYSAKGEKDSFLVSHIISYSKDEEEVKSKFSIKNNGDVVISGGDLIVDNLKIKGKKTVQDYFSYTFEQTQLSNGLNNLYNMTFTDLGAYLITYQIYVMYSGDTEDLYDFALTLNDGVKDIQTSYDWGVKNFYENQCYLLNVTKTRNIALNLLVSNLGDDPNLSFYGAIQYIKISSY